MHVRCNNSYRFSSNKTHPQNSFECITVATRVRYVTKPSGRTQYYRYSANMNRSSGPFKPTRCLQSVFSHHQSQGIRIKMQRLWKQFTFNTKRFVVFMKCGKKQRFSAPSRVFLQALENIMDATLATTQLMLMKWKLLGYNNYIRQMEVTLVTALL